MKPEIKERIEQIKKGQVPEGYKKTKVGIVPNEWEVKRLRENALIVDGTHQTPRYTSNGIPFVSVENIGNINNTDKYISNEDFEKYKVKPQKNDILMTRITAGIIGDTEIIQNNNPLAYYVSLALIRVMRDYNVDFLNNFIGGFIFKKELNKRIIHTAFPKKINLNDIGECKTVIPSLSEQQKIADILSTQDKIIELKEKLIDEKQKQKKYLMQMLLTGKKRLKGFDGEWKKVKLEEITSLRGGYAFKSESFIEVGIPIIKISNILDNGTVGGRFSYYEEQLNDTQFLLPDNSILLAMSGATTGKIAILRNLEDKKIYQNQRVGYFRDLSKISYSFLSFVISSSLFSSKIRKILVAGAQPNISSKDIDEFVFYIPTDQKEQISIANILSTQDKEIELLQQDLEQEKQKKKALMQLLLTGIVRV